MERCPGLTQGVLWHRCPPGPVLVEGVGCPPLCEPRGHNAAICHTRAPGNQRHDHRKIRIMSSLSASVIFPVRLFLSQMSLGRKQFSQIFPCNEGSWGHCRFGPSSRAALFYTASTSQGWPQSTGRAALVTQELHFQFCLILINFKLKMNSRFSC